MDSLSREIFIETIQNDSVVKFIELCDIVNPDDLVMLDNAVITRIEEYINQCLPLKFDDEIKSLISEYDSFFNESFRFKPLDVIRIIRASNKLKCALTQGNRRKSGSVSNNNSEEDSNLLNDEFTVDGNRRFNNTFLDDCLPPKMPKLMNDFLPSDHAKTLLKLALPQSNFPTNFLETFSHTNKLAPLSDTVSQVDHKNGHSNNNSNINESSPSVISNEDELNRRSEIDNIAYRISQHAENYFSVKLKHKENFDVEFEMSKDQVSGDVKKSGIFLCYLCNSVKGGTSRIRFNITSKNYYVLSNVSTHLTKHFEKNNRRSNVIS